MDLITPHTTITGISCMPRELQEHYRMNECTVASGVITLDCAGVPLLCVYIVESRGFFPPCEYGAEIRSMDGIQKFMEKLGVNNVPAPDRQGRPVPELEGKKVLGMFVSKERAYPLEGLLV